MGSSSTMGAKAFLAIAAAAFAVICVAALAAFFASRDEATVPQRQDDAPGVPRRANSQPAVKPGNVVLRYSDERLTRDLRALAASIAGEPSPALEAAGQAVLVQREPDVQAPVTALSATRRLQAGGPRDPALRSFVEYWLGRAS